MWQQPSQKKKSSDPSIPQSRLQISFSEVFNKNNDVC